MMPPIMEQEVIYETERAVKEYEEARATYGVDSIEAQEARRRLNQMESMDVQVTDPGLAEALKRDR